MNVNFYYANEFTVSIILKMLHACKYSILVEKCVKLILNTQ